MWAAEGWIFCKYHQGDEKRDSEWVRGGLLWRWKEIKLNWIRCTHFVKFLILMSLPAPLMLKSMTKMVSGWNVIIISIKWINVMIFSWIIIFAKAARKWAQKKYCLKFFFSSIFTNREQGFFMQNFPVEQFFRNSEVKCSIKSHKSSFSLSLARWCVHVY